MKLTSLKEFMNEHYVERVEEASDFSDPDKIVSYDTFAKAYADSYTRNTEQLKIIQKYFKSKEEPFKQSYGGNDYRFFAQLFETKDKSFKIFIKSPMSTSSSSTYDLMLADKYEYSKFSVEVSLKVRDFKQLNNHIIIDGLKELYNKALTKYESDERYKRIGKFVFKANLLKIIK